MALVVPKPGDRVASPLRWAGGKRWLLAKVAELVAHQEISVYHEPFLGGASIFLGLDGIQQAYLRDANKELIATYRAIKARPVRVAKLVCEFSNDKDTYYRVRESAPNGRFEKAARFIYLNHTSFNGIYRVNLKGVYNVPFGSRPNPQIPTAEHLKRVAERLANATLEVGDFADCLKDVKKGHLVFLDPPYTVAHNDNGFIKYNHKLFSFEDQKRLSKLIDEIKKKGAYYILANACHESIAKLFTRKWNSRTETSRRNAIGGNGAERGSATEYLFTNLKPSKR
jgi:DNA adenine methylase